MEWILPQILMEVEGPAHSVLSIPMEEEKQMIIIIVIATDMDIVGGDIHDIIRIPDTLGIIAIVIAIVMAIINGRKQRMWMITR